MTPSTPVETGQVREYLMSNGILYGTFRVVKEGQDGLFWHCEWETGDCAGQSQRFHSSRIRECAVVEA